MQNRNPRLSVRYPCFALLCVFSLLICLPSFAQGPNPSVAFTCDFPGSDPSHYAVSVTRDGHGSYISDGKLTKDSDSDEPFRMDFTVSQLTVSHVFDLARSANYFQGNIESKKKNIASTGSKALIYKDGQRNTMGSYDYSTVPAVQEITRLFQNMSTTLEFGRRLEYDYRYQKLALDEELKRMEDVSKEGGLVELSAVAPILQKISDDQSVINGVRARAQRMLQTAGAAK